MQRVRNIAAAMVVVGCALWVAAPARALQPFWLTESFPIGNSDLGIITSFPIPANMMWVVESVSGRLQLPTGQHVANAMISSPTENPNPTIWLEPRLVSQNVSINEVASDIYLFNQATRVYLTNQVQVTLLRAETGGDAQFDLSINGYLLPAVSGDFNANGTVDAADYVVWRNNLGRTGTGLFADADSSGTVDAPDISVWAAQFGTTSSESASAAASLLAIPEPAALTLLAMALVTAVHLRRRS